MYKCDGALYLREGERDVGDGDGGFVDDAQDECRLVALLLVDDHVKLHIHGIVVNERTGATGRRLLRGTF